MKTAKMIFLLVMIMQTDLSFSQDLIKKFGNPDITELTMQSYTKDKSAEALVIYDVGKSYFVENTAGNGFNVIFERTTRIKIFSKAGLKYAQVEIPYYQEKDIYEDVYDIEGFTYNLENSELKRVPFDQKQVYKEKSTEAWNLKKFALPDVREGSVIEYRYKINSPYKFNLHDWEFQWRIPVKYSEYTVRMIPFYTYTNLIQGVPKLDVFDSYEDTGIKTQFGSVSFNDMVYRYGLKDIPAFNDESFITSINDYIIKINFQLSGFTDMYGTKSEVLSTWPKMCNDLLKDGVFGKYMSSSESKGEKLQEQFNLTGKKNIEVLEYLVDYVKMNYKWNDTYSTQTFKSLKQFMEEKSGNSANINLFLAGLLNSAKIQAFPVLISTRAHGKIKSEFPFLHFFNSVVVLVKIDSTWMLTDATEPFCAFNKIPPQCLNERGLIVKKNSQDWVTLVNNRISEKKYEMLLDLTPKLDSVTGRFSISATEYDAIDLRDKYLNSKKDFKKIMEKNGLTIKDSILVSNLLETKKPVVVSFNASIQIDTIDGKLLVMPFLKESVTVNPLKQSNRDYPVDFTYAKSRTFETTISIPEGYFIKNLPQNALIDNANYHFSYEAKKVSEKSLIIISNYTFKKAVYEPAIYIGVKFFYDDIIRKLTEPLVFEKKQKS